MAPPTASPEGARSPGLAAVLTLLVPGGGHLYLGRTAWAVAGFVVVGGLYLLGVRLSGGMFLEYLPPEMRGAFAWILTPELGNLGFLYWHQGEFGYGIGQPRPWPATMHLGTTLTAASGVLNLLLASRAHLDARLTHAPGRTRPRPGPAQAALASWLVPGLGQFLQGRRLRGLVVFVLLVGLFCLGTLLAEGSNLDRERHFYYWAGQFWLGLPAIVTEFVHGHPRMTESVPYAAGGVVLASIAGLLNVLSLMDAYAASDERIFPEAHAGSEDGDAAPATGGEAGA